MDKPVKAGTFIFVVLCRADTVDYVEIWWGLQYTFYQYTNNISKCVSLTIHSLLVHSIIISESVCVVPNSSPSVTAGKQQLFRYYKLLNWSTHRKILYGNWDYLNNVLFDNTQSFTVYDLGLSMCVCWAEFSAWVCFIMIKVTYYRVRKLATMSH